ncbi:MAG: trypsin-like peptidase domain-containing protein [Acidimicrobiales bacterium]
MTDTPPSAPEEQPSREEQTVPEFVPTPSAEMPDEEPSVQAGQGSTAPHVPEESIALSGASGPSTVPPYATEPAVAAVSDTPPSAPEITGALRDEHSSSSMIVDEVPLSSQRKNRSLWSTRVSLLLVAALVGGLAGHFAAPTSSNGGQVTINQVSTPPGTGAASGGMNIPKLVQRALPSIVSIDVTGNGEEDQGTGMIITKNGLVVTNNHVIAASVNGGTITVTRSGTTKSLPATLVGTNPIDDVALIRIDNASHLPIVTFGKSNDLEVGDAVVAIGNALGLAAGTPTVTSGIVSALGRTVTAGSTTSTETLTNMIQTDAAINPGNSGGPLLDSSGDVIGMDTAVAGTLSDGENTQNIGFAIPTATIQSLLPTLIAGESVVNHGAFIGVEIESMTPSLKSEYNFSVSTGAVVISVIAGTGAAAAGVKQGDVIVGINSTTIESAQDVTSVISSLHPGDVITLHIVRGTKHLSLKVTLGRTPSS